MVLSVAATAAAGLWPGAGVRLLAGGCGMASVPGPSLALGTASFCGFQGLDLPCVPLNLCAARDVHQTQQPSAALEMHGGAVVRDASDMCLLAQILTFPRLLRMSPRPTSIVSDGSLAVPTKH